jgi:hypothetical protein
LGNGAVVATSKHETRAADRPDAAAFTRLIDEDLAEPAVVSAAYRAALGKWSRGKTYTHLLAMASVDGGLVQGRSDIERDEEPTPEARLIALQREELFEHAETRDALEEES